MSTAVSEQCRAVSGQCRGSVGAVSVDTCVGVSSRVGAVSEQCRPVSGILDSGPPCTVSRVSRVSECRSVGVSSSVEQCRSVGVSGCRGPTSLACLPCEPYSFTQSNLLGKQVNVPLVHLL